MASKSESKVSTNPDEIRKWAEDRGAQPSCVRGTGGKGDIGMLRLDFPGYSGEDTLEHIEWDEWFGKFEERGLALLFQESTAAGEKSNFNKIVSRETANDLESGKTGKKKSKETKKSGSSSRTAGKTKKLAPKKSVAKKSVANQSVTKKAAVKKAIGKKTTAKKAGAKKTASRKR